MFDDAGWLGARYDAQHDALRGWLARAGRVAVVEIGAGTAVPTVRFFSERIGDDVIRINVREAHAQCGDVIGLPGGALETLRALDAAWGGIHARLRARRLLPCGCFARSRAAWATRVGACGCRPLGERSTGYRRRSGRCREKRKRPCCAHRLS
ncbi:putative nAD-dependent deacetylase [Burkholderia thailandensis MSMB121]|nr:hypothetical protein [Burkholderia humptydooensis]AGK46522.1 putative nAD-dependent deacetylase [Burkholderia thailandensis MSMB121]KST73539.1 hypothetical protein WS76_04720 [Burkholderia humptydooensis]